MKVVSFLYYYKPIMLNIYKHIMPYIYKQSTLRRYKPILSKPAKSAISGKSCGPFPVWFSLEWAKAFLGPVFFQHFERTVNPDSATAAARVACDH
jgi:hypothetical protein